MSTGSPAAPTIRVASYNLRRMRDDTRAAVAVVRAIDPDVLLLQEVPRSPASGYRISDFARRARLYWSGRSHRLAGTSVMTGLRVVATDAVDRPLPVPFPQNPRAYSLTHVTVPGAGRLTAVSIHLPLDGDQRAAHVQRLLRALAEDADTDLDHLVIGGDLNEGSEAGAWSTLAARMRQVSPGAPTYPARRPRRCIDAIFAGAGLEAAPHAGVSLDAAQLAAATDHLPVWADLVARRG